MIHSKSLGERTFNIANAVIMAVLAFSCIYPLWYALCLSLSNKAAANSGLVTFYPIGFALEKYKKDYETKNLNLKGNRAYRAYGALEGRMIWGQVSNNIFMNAESRPKMELGYQFKQNSPYFTVYYQSAENIKSTDSEKEKSMAIITYFTRAQAEELVKLFDQQYLLSFIGPRPAPEDAVPTQEDDYDGYTEVE